jgi:AcrR family transcriptional regulator
MSSAPRSAKTGEKTRYHHGDLRQVLLDAAARMLREDGETGLSMRKLASQVGVSRTAAYHHFRDKHDLLCAVAQEGFRRFRVTLYPSAIDPERPMNREQVLAMVRGYVDFATANSEYYDLMFGSQLWKTGALTATLTEEAHGAFRAYVDGIRHWRDRGLVPAGLDPLRYAQVSWSTLHGMSRLLIDGIYVDSAARRAMCRAAADMLWRELNEAPAP